MAKEVGHYDLDSAKWAVASVGETRSVVVRHKTSGRTLEVSNRTEFYGHWKKKSGGMLAEINKGRDSPFSWDEFEYEDVQTPEPIENILHTAKLVVDGAVKRSGADDIKFYIGQGEVFRVDRSTLLKYKGNRENLLKPLMMEEVVEYLTKKYKPEIVTGIETDDAVTMATYNKPNHFIIGADKDYYGTGSRFYNLHKEGEGVVDTTGLGTLWLDSKGGVRGTGVLFKLWQVCSQDTSDNYAANCISDIKWGDKRAYNSLVDCKTFKEAFTSASKVFKHLYPEPFKFNGWRGEEIDVDWLYVFQECLDLAHLHRWDNDFISLTDVFDKLKINAEEL